MNGEEDVANDDGFIEVEPLSDEEEEGQDHDQSFRQETIPVTSSERGKVPADSPVLSPRGTLPRRQKIQQEASSDPAIVMAAPSLAVSRSASTKNLHSSSSENNMNALSPRSGTGSGSGALSPNSSALSPRSASNGININVNALSPRGTHLTPSSSSSSVAPLDTPRMPSMTVSEVVHGRNASGTILASSSTGGVGKRIMYSDEAFSTLLVEESTTAEDLMRRFRKKVQFSGDGYIYVRLPGKPTRGLGMHEIISQVMGGLSILQAPESVIEVRTIAGQWPDVDRAAIVAAGLQDSSAVSSDTLVRGENVWELVFPLTMKTGTDVPEPRRNPCVIIPQIGPNATAADGFYVFGGMTEKGKSWTADLHRYHVGNKTWTRIKSKNKSPPHITGHQIVTTKDGFIMFGGNIDGSVKKFINDLWEFHFELRTWSKISPSKSSPLPSKRAYHCATWYDGGHIIIFGGHDPKTVYGDTWMYSVLNRTWVKMADGPSPRHSSAMVSCPDLGGILLFGGTDGKIVHGDLWLFKVQNNEWKKICNDDRYARRSHAAVIHNGSMYVFGGSDSRGKIRSSLIEYDLKLESWSFVEVQGIDKAEKESVHIPSGRTAHNIFVFDECLWVFGGKIADDTGTYSNELFQFSVEDKHFRHGMMNLLKSGRRSDVTLKSRDGGSIKSHRAILSVRAPKLIPEIKGDSLSMNLSNQELNAFLLAVYTERDDLLDALNLESLFNVSQACALYGVIRLGCITDQRIMQMVNEDNIAASIMFAAKRNLINLRNYCINYTVKNSAAVLKRPDMKTVDPQLLVNIISYCSDPKEMPMASSINIPLQSLKSDLSSLVGKKDFSDITLNVAGNMIPLHSCIVGERSDFFRNLPTGMVAKEETGLPLELIKSFIRYLYTDLIDFPSTHALFLLKAAAYYKIIGDRLRFTCYKVIRLKFSNDLLLPGLEIADDLKDDSVKNFLLGLIVSNWSTIGINEYMSKLEKRPHLLSLILRGLSSSLASKGIGVKKEGSSGGSGSVEQVVDNAKSLIRPEHVWSNVNVVKGSTCGERSSSCLVHAPDYQITYLFGGTGGKNAFSDDLMAFDHRKNVWSNVKTRGKVESRCAHTLNLISHSEASYLLLFGGSSSSGKLNPSNDMFVFDIAQSTWRKSKADKPPKARAFHVSIVRQNVLYVIGGATGKKDKDAFIGDMYSYTHGTQTWAVVGESDILAREGSAAIYDEANDSMYLFGGITVGGISNDLFRFTFKDCKWLKISSIGVPPTPRYGHSAVYANSCMFVFGGCSKRGSNQDLFQFDLETKLWCNVDTSGSIFINPRFRFACCAYNNVMYVYGGQQFENSSSSKDVSLSAPLTSGTFSSEFLDISLGDNCYRSALAKLYETGEFSDVKFVCNDSIPVNGHLCILKARCPSLLQRLSNSGDSISVSLSSSEFGCVRLFLYTDVVEISSLSLENLFNISSFCLKVGLHRLNYVMEYSIQKLITEDTVGPALMMAHTRQLENLLNFVIGFIVKNSKPIMKRPEMKVVDPMILLDIARYCADSNQTPKYIEPKTSPPSLQTDLSKIAFETQFSDAFFVACDNNSYPFHRAIFAARSEWFGDACKNQKKGFQIRDEMGAPGDVVVSFMKFVYGDVVDFPPSHAIRLLQMCKAYRLNGTKLEVICGNVIRKGIKREDLLPAMEVADRMEDIALKQFVMGRIVTEFAVMGMNKNMKEEEEEEEEEEKEEKEN